MELAKMTGMTPPELTLRGRRVDWPPIILRPTMRLAYWTGMRRSERSTKTMKATTAIMPAMRTMMAMGVKAPQARVASLLVEVFNAARQADDDAGEDEQAHAVADAALGDLLTQPHDEGGAGGEGDDAERDEGSAGDGDHRLAGAGAGQREGDGEGLHDAQQDRDVAGPLGDLAAAEFAFLLKLRERLVDDGEQLEDDRRRDVRHDAEGEDGELAQVSAGEEVDQAEG